MDPGKDIWEHSFPRTCIEKEEIHVWRTALDQELSTVRVLFETLSMDERQRAEKYHFEKDRDHFIVARGSLRKILGGYLDVEPSQIRFSYTRFGKPFLAIADNLFRFNISHSRDLALIAVTKAGEIGIDIEFVTENFEIMKTAASIFSPREISELETLPRELQTTAFFCGWTRKEAYLKAIGEGFSNPANQFTVSIKPEETDILVKNTELNRFRNWSLISLPVDHKYVAALAVEGRNQTVRYWQ